MSKFENEKIIHSKAMRNYLLSNGGVLVKIKPNLKRRGEEVYIFQADTIAHLMGGYKNKEGVSQ